MEIFGLWKQNHFVDAIISWKVGWFGVEETHFRLHEKPLSSFDNKMSVFSIGEP